MARKSQAKPFKQDGVWVFADGTPIPNQARAAVDPQYRDTSNGLHMLKSRFTPDHARPVSDARCADDLRRSVGWDANRPGLTEDESEALIASLEERIGITAPADERVTVAA